MQETCIQVIFQYFSGYLTVSWGEKENFIDSRQKCRYHIGNEKRVCECV